MDVIDPIEGDEYEEYDESDYEYVDDDLFDEDESFGVERKSTLRQLASKLAPVKTFGVKALSWGLWAVGKGGALTWYVSTTAVMLIVPVAVAGIAEQQLVRLQELEMKAQSNPMAGQEMPPQSGVPSNI